MLIRGLSEIKSPEIRAVDLQHIYNRLLIHLLYIFMTAVIAIKKLEATIPHSKDARKLNFS